MLESFFNKAAGRRFVTLFKRASNADLFSCEICDTFKNNYFRRTLPVAVVLYLFAASDFFWKFESVYNVFYELLPLKLPVTFPKNFI